MTYLLTETMDAKLETENVEAIAADEPFLGPLDIVLLIGLLIGGIYWLLSNRKKEQASQVKSYSIQ